MNALALALLACAARADPQPPALKEAAPVTETIDETTVGDLDGNRVPMANMTQGKYTRADGVAAEGWTCTLVLKTGATVVGVGSVVEVGDQRWEVTAVEKTVGTLGSVTLVKK